MKTTQILAGITSCLSTVAGGLLAFLSILGFIDSIQPHIAIGFAWWSLSLSVLAVVLAHVVVVVGARRQSIGPALGFYLPVVSIAPIVIVVMVLRLLIFYS